MRKIVIGNWKMNPHSFKEAEIIFKDILRAKKSLKNINIIICPPALFLSIAQKIKSNLIKFGAQDVSQEMEGAHTGEISSPMLISLGVKYVIVGHSERRQQGESNQTINRKILTCLKSKISPILCVGESTRDKEGDYLNFVKDQIEQCLWSVPKTEVKNIIIAYEPLWAIGQGASREATVEEFVEIKIFIKKIIADLYDIKTTNKVSVIYGGSVNPQNANTFIVEGKADGLLVGRDSLNSKKFLEIIQSIK